MTTLTPPEVAVRWKCKPETVVRLLRSGILRGFTVSPPGAKRPRWRVTLDAVRAYEDGDVESTMVQSQKRRCRQRMEVPTGPF
jgi:hypothetical protein